MCTPKWQQYRTRFIALTATGIAWLLSIIASLPLYYLARVMLVTTRNDPNAVPGWETLLIPYFMIIKLLKLSLPGCMAE